MHPLGLYFGITSSQREHGSAPDRQRGAPFRKG